MFFGGLATPLLWWQLIELVWHPFWTCGSLQAGVRSISEGPKGLLRCFGGKQKSNSSAAKQTKKTPVGDGSELRLAHELHYESDIEIVKLLRHYIKKHDIPGLEKLAIEFSAAEFERGGLVSAFRDDEARTIFGNIVSRMTMSIEKLDGILQEMAHICRELESYDATMRSVVEDAKSYMKSSKNPAKLDGKFPDVLPKESKINTLRHELISYYVKLEEFNMHLQVYQVSTAFPYSFFVLVGEEEMACEEPAPSLCETVRLPPLRRKGWSRSRRVCVASKEGKRGSMRLNPGRCVTYIDYRRRHFTERRKTDIGFL